MKKFFKVFGIVIGAIAALTAILGAIYLLYDKKNLVEIDYDR
jgi:hypothetical protein